VQGWIAAAIDHPEDRFGDQTPEDGSRYGGVRRTSAWR